MNRDIPRSDLYERNGSGAGRRGRARHDGLGRAWTTSLTSRQQDHTAQNGEDGADSPDPSFPHEEGDLSLPVPAGDQRQPGQADPAVVAGPQTRLFDLIERLFRGQKIEQR